MSQKRKHNNVTWILGVTTCFYRAVTFYSTDSQQNYMSMGVCRTESLNIQLEVAPGQSSGLAVHEDNSMLVISHVAAQSPAYR